jgi:AraC family transcriptional regulator, transcriptional activator of pobA
MSNNVQKKAAIPVNNFGGEFDSGIVIEKIALNDLPNLEEWTQPERHDRH